VNNELILKISYKIKKGLKG